MVGRLTSGQDWKCKISSVGAARVVLEWEIGL